PQSAGSWQAVSGVSERHAAGHRRGGPAFHGTGLRVGVLRSDGEIQSVASSGWSAGHGRAPAAGGLPDQRPYQYRAVLGPAPESGRAGHPGSSRPEPETMTRLIVPKE